MKKLSYATLILFIMLSCSNNTKTETLEDKAKNLIESYLHDNLKDPSSYESVSYTILDSVFSTLEDDGLYSKSTYYLESENRKFKHIMEMQDIWVSEYSEQGRKQFKKFQDEAQTCIAEMEKYKSIIDSIEQNFISDWNGRSVTHTYRAKNGFGALDLFNRRFVFDKEVQSILSSDEIK